MRSHHVAEKYYTYLEPMDIPLYLFQRLTETKIVSAGILAIEVRLALLVDLRRVE
jgi:hypothetical protein